MRLLHSVQGMLHATGGSRNKSQNLLRSFAARILPPLVVQHTQRGHVVGLSGDDLHRVRQLSPMCVQAVHRA